MTAQAFTPTTEAFVRKDDHVTAGAFEKMSGGDYGDDHYFRPFELSNRLTVSFAPDGTNVLDKQSNLYEAFAGMLSPQELESEILRSFQIWTREANLNVGLVGDSDDDFGISGLTYGDSRFGDVRIGAIPMASDVYAIALSQGEFFSGTWAGDILFNSNAVFSDVDQFFSVALHEAGHALGLKHSTNPLSPMYTVAGPTDLIAEDVANIHALYGIRSLDIFDNNGQNNDSLGDASQIQFINENDGLLPSIIFGDMTRVGISDSTPTRDLDFFELSIDNYSGQATFNLLSDGISLLTPALSIYNQNGQLVQVLTSTSDRGDQLTYSFSTADLDERVYAGVSASLAADMNQIGSYALITTFDDTLTVDLQDVLDFARSHFMRASEEDVFSYFANGGQYLFNEDGHNNEDTQSATELEIEDGYLQSNRYELSASLTDEIDVDVYRVESEEFNPDVDRFLNVTVRSPEIGGLVPTINVLDEDGNAFESRILVNQRGEVVVQVSDIQPDVEYFVQVAAHESMPFTSGNYEMTISFGEREVNLQDFAGGSLSLLRTTQYHSLHIAQSQMFHFALQADESELNEAVIWATIYDVEGNIVYVGGTIEGETFTSHATFFSPGSYIVEIELVQDSGGFPQSHIRLNDSISYHLLGINIGDSQGAAVIDPTESPFDQNEEGGYIYPDDVVSDVAFVFVDGLASNLPDPPDDEPPKFDIFDWYWQFGI